MAEPRFLSADPDSPDVTVTISRLPRERDFTDGGVEIRLHLHAPVFSQGLVPGSDACRSLMISPPDPLNEGYYLAKHGLLNHIAALLDAKWEFLKNLDCNDPRRRSLCP